jgi:hypothetical protein
MKLEGLEIVERSSGFWVVDNSGVVDGPFDTVTEAQAWVDDNCTD